MGLYARESDCSSHLGRRMQNFRTDRPSEWLMDEFIDSVEELSVMIKVFKACIDTDVLPSKDSPCYQRLSDIVEKIA
jgi:hypothetical protein